MTDDDQTIDRSEMRARQRSEAFATMSISGGEPVQIVGLVTIGRDPKSAAGLTVSVDGDPLVSKSHLALDLQSDQLVITDLGSSNGTFLHHAGQETPVPTDRWIPVPDGADVEFGDQRMTIQAADRRTVVAAPTPAGSAAELIADSAVDTPACSSCARPLEPGARFCDVCGTPASTAAPGETSHQSTGNRESQNRDSQNRDSQIVGPAFEPVQAVAPSFVEPPAGGAVRRSPAKKIMAIIAILVALGLAAIVLTRVLDRDDDDGSARRGLLELPLTLDEQWSESVSGELFDASIGESSVYVASGLLGEQMTLTSLTSNDGVEQWEANVPVAQPYSARLVGEYGNIAVFHACGASCAVVGIDRSTGDIEWDRENADSLSAFDADGRLLVFEDNLELLDPSDGSRLERTRGSISDLGSGSTVVVRDGNEVEVFDFDLASVFGPVDVDSDATAFAFTGSQLIAAVDDELQFLDERGDVVKESSLDGAGAITIDFVADDNVIVTTSESVVSFDPIDGDADMRWSEDGFRRDLIRLEDGVVVFIESFDRPDVDVIDAETGDRRFRIDDLAGFDRIVAADPGTTGILVTSKESDSEDLDAQALDWANGKEIWSEQFDGDVTVGEGALVEITLDGDVTLYR